MHACLRALAGHRCQTGQAMQAPDVAGILDLPPGAFVQGFDDVVGEEQKPLVVALFRSGELTPLLCGAVEQRGHAGVGDHADRPCHDRRLGDDRGLVVATLNRVLQLECELGRQPAEVDAGPAALQTVREVVRAVGTAQLPPPRRVGLAVPIPGVLGPQRAKRQQALRGIGWAEQARPSGPPLGVWPAVAGPGRPVTHTQSANRYCRNGIRTPSRGSDPGARSAWAPGRRGTRPSPGGPGRASADHDPSTARPRSGTGRNRAPRHRRPSTGSSGSAR